jgi:transposase
VCGSDVDITTFLSAKPHSPAIRPRPLHRRSDTPTLTRLKTLTAVAARLAGTDGLIARLAAELTGQITALTAGTNDLEREITVLVRQLAPSLLAVPGVAELTAAKIVRQTRCHPPGRAHLKARMAARNTRTEALRALKRRLSDIVYNALLADGTPVPLRQAA